MTPCDGVGTTYIRNARIVRPGIEGDLPRQDVLVRATLIEALPATPEEQRKAAESATEVIDAEGMYLMPGAVNAHYHSYGSALKGTRNDLPLECWSPYTIAYGQALSPEAVRLAVMLGAAEMIRGGITACIDHFPNLALADVALDAHRRSGMRVGFAPMMQDVADWQFFDLDLPPGLRATLGAQKPMTPAAFADFFVDLHCRWHDPAGRLTILLGPNAPQRCSAAMRAVWRQLDDRLQVRVHTHLLETRAQACRCAEVFPGGLVAMLRREGLLNDRLSAAHGIWTNPEDRRTLAAHGVTVVNNPSANCTLGSGTMPLIDYLKDGAHAALGTDSSNAGGRLDLFEAMRLALTLPRLQTREFATWPAVDAIWRMASEGGARAMGLADRLGAIEVGRCADLVLLDGTNPALTGLGRNLQTVVCHGGREAVKAVMIDGSWVYRDGRVLSFDEAAVVEEFNSLIGRTLRAAEPGLRLARELQSYLSRLDLD